MAIIDNLPGIQVTIECNGQALKEYDDDEMKQNIGKDAMKYGGPKASKYIECLPDEELDLYNCQQASAASNTMCQLSCIYWWSIPNTSNTSDFQASIWHS